MPTPLSVTLAELRNWPPLGVVAEAIDHLGADSPPDTSMPLAALVRATDEDEQSMLLDLLTQLQPAAIRAWVLDCADVALADAERALPHYSGYGQRSGVGPANVVEYASLVLGALRRGERIDVRRDWFTWSRHHIWYLGIYAASRKTPSPYLCTAWATVAAFRAHGGHVRVSPTPEHPEQPREFRDLDCSLLELIEAVAGAAREAWAAGQPSLPKSADWAARWEREDRQQCIEALRTAWCWERLAHHLDPPAAAPPPRKGLRVIDGGGQPAQPRRGRRSGGPRAI